MSFILDALRKSESERQRLSSTAIAELPLGRRRSGQPWWVLALAALLVLNLVVLAILLVRDKPSSTITVAPSATVAPIAAPAAQLSAQSSTDAAPLTQRAAVNSTSPLQDAAQASNDVRYETVSRTELEIANAAASVPAGASIVRPFDASSANAVKSAPASINDAPATASADLHLDLHVYSNNDRERFVLINMKRYMEGQQLTNGATIEQIVPDGVIIYQNGMRYKLDRR